MSNVFTADALNGQVVFITGASRGIGAAILDACLAAGATVIGTATSESGAAAKRFCPMRLPSTVRSRCLSIMPVSPVTVWRCA